jgi:glycosyltransferase involved in cell wall biosynthesis
MNLCVIIPSYNEEKSIVAVIEKVKEYTEEIIVVDDGSKDNTGKKAEEVGATVLKHIINLGKGAAAKTGCDYAYLQKYEQIILLDGDGQHDPKEIPNLIEQLKHNDMVFGCRIFNKNMPLILRLGNKGINLITRALYGINIKDTQSGYRAFNTKIYKKIRWQASDYSMESEMIANAGKAKIKYTEISIDTIYTDNYKGTTILDGIKIVFNMITWRLK